MDKWPILLGFFLVSIFARQLLAEKEPYGTSRAINATGLWSKYNLIVKPTIEPKRVSSTTIESRWSPIDLPEEQNQDDSVDDEDENDEEEEDEEDEEEDVVTSTQRSSHKPSIRPAEKVDERKHKKKIKGSLKGHVKLKGLKKLKKYMLPLLLAYKLKFFTLVPLLLGGLVLIVATTGFAGFFFALFAVGVGLKKD